MNTPTNAPRIGVVGLGPVGTVTAACLARLGFDVLVHDRDANRQAAVLRGDPPAREAELDAVLADALRAGRLTGGTMADAAARDVTLVCIGTPVAMDGSTDPSRVFSVVEALTAHNECCVVVVRSTVPPGTIHQAVRDAADANGGPRAPAAMWPEFLREGCAVADFMNPVLTVFGGTDDVALRRLAPIADALRQTPDITGVAEAEALKLACNAWHATKIAFANEMGRYMSAAGIDARAVMTLFRRDTRLNVSAAYLRPGFAYGGSCLPKDLRALGRLARSAEVDMPVIESVQTSNTAHIDHAAARIRATGRAPVALLGTAFKTDTDDLRESPRCGNGPVSARNGREGGHPSR